MSDDQQGSGGGIFDTLINTVIVFSLFLMFVAEGHIIEFFVFWGVLWLARFIYRASRKP